MANKNVEIEEMIQEELTEAAEVAEVETEEKHLPNPFKAIGNGIKKHWKGFLIGAGAAAGAAVFAYMKGRDSVIEALSFDDDELDEDDDDIVDTEATEVTEESDD